MALLRSPGSRGYGSSGSRVELEHDAARTLLALMTQTGGLLHESAHGEAPQGVRYDDAASARLERTLQASSAPERIEITARWSIDGEPAPSEAVIAALDGDFIRIGERIVRVADPSDSAWMRTFNAGAKLEAPRENALEVLREIEQNGLPVSLAPGLGLLREDLEPRAVLTLVDPTDSDLERNLVRGRLEFDYGGARIRSDEVAPWVDVDAEFKELLRRPAGLELEREARAELARLVRPFVLRRTKEQVLRDLPAKSEQVVACELEGRERKEYDALRKHYRQRLLGASAKKELDHFSVLEALLRLRQAACHPGLLDTARAGDSSAKLELVLEHVTEALEGGHKALVFSQFTSLLAIVRQRLDERDVPYAYIDGGTTAKERVSAVQRFQEDSGCGLMLSSLKAGGVGLNLTAADYVFLLDPWWNSSAEAQAIGRAHRIGQPRSVFAYRFVSSGTIEVRVLELQERKRELATEILDGEATTLRDLTREDLERLLR